MRTHAWLRLGLIATGALAVGCSERKPYVKPPTPVQVQAVQTQAEAGGIRYSAAIVPNTRVDAAFKAGGYIESLGQIPAAGQVRDVQEGDLVTRGTVLAQVRQADYEQKVKQAQSQLAEALAVAEQARQAYERATALFAAQTITRPDYESAQTANATVQARVSGARALVQEAENALADCKLIAPIDGVVLKRLIEKGSLVGPGTLGFILADTSQVKVVFGAPDVLVKDLKLESVQMVTTEASPDSIFRGLITRIAAAAHPTSRVFDVEITLPNPGNRLKVGMVAALQVSDPHTSARPESQIGVPLAAVVRSKTNRDGYAVFTVEQSGDKQVAVMHDVSLGKAYGNQISVKEGLKAGERVIVRGTALVTDGEAVAVIP